MPNEEKKLRERNFAALNDREQVGVLREADKVAGFFSRIYARFLALVSPNRAERYKAFLDSNPYMQGNRLEQNCYVPNSENSAPAPFQNQDDRHVNISLFPEETTPNGPPRVVPIDAFLKELEAEL